MSVLPYYYGAKDKFFTPSLFNSSFNEIVPHDVFHPLAALADIFKPLDQLSTALNKLAVNDLNSNVTSDNEKFQVNVDVRHFAPEEVSVKVIDGSVIVQGKHEEKQDEHGYVSRQFVRKYALPKGCLPDTVESKLSSDGVLIVTAPKVLPMPSPGERIVPIKHTGPVKKQIAPEPAIKIT